LRPAAAAVGQTGCLNDDPRTASRPCGAVEDRLIRSPRRLMSRHRERIARSAAGQGTFAYAGYFVGSD